MRSPLERVTEAQVADAIVDGWGLRVDQLRYFPEGGGAYHWHARSNDARRWFITCDDLDTKPWLGVDRDEVFEGLLAAYATAVDLHAGGAGFVVAPIATLSGHAAMRIDDRHSVSLFEHIDGEAGRWGEPLPPRGRRELVALLARLHGATPSETIPRRELDVPGRAAFDDALATVESRWDAGPLSELARIELVRHASTIGDALAEMDRAASRLAASGEHAVITHGEPHPGNLIVTASGLALVDWDTVARARPERDLWMIADDEHLLDRYGALTGFALDADALSAYRSLWALADLASFTALLRGDHDDSTDTRRALEELRLILDGHEPDPYGAK